MEQNSAGKLSFCAAAQGGGVTQGIEENQRNAMKMNMKKWFLLALMSSLVAACSTSPRTPAPVVERTSGARVERVAGPGYHIVKKGDTLNRIAHRYGQRVPDLVAWNNLSNPNDIKLDQMLRVQRPDGAGSNAQTASVTSSNAEVRPLGAPAGAVSGTNKTEPRGEKKPYSEQALAGAKKPAVAPAPVMAAAPAAAAKAAPAQAEVVEAKPPVPTVADTSLAPRDEDAIAWMWPTDGRILATYRGMSKGIDIAGKTGQKVVAAADGQVSYVGALRGYGNLVIVKHNENIQSVYAHNSKNLVKEKQTVKRGQQIAEIGNTDSDVVKLHFEVRRSGKPIDPARFLPIR